MGENGDRPDLEQTPSRVAKFFLSYSPDKEKPKMTTFDNNSRDLIVEVKDLEVRSLCGHHLLPFFGVAKVIYVPKHKKAGLSKFQRALDYISERPQDQESITKELLDFLWETLEPDYLAVKLECTHTCMMVRGVKSTSAITTTIQALGSVDVRLNERINKLL